MPTFEWDSTKNLTNQQKHGVSFSDAQRAFFDPQRLMFLDGAHSQREARYYCIGHDGLGILTVRFTYRRKHIRIIGAGYWRKGKALYEKENPLYR